MKRVLSVVAALMVVAFVFSVSAQEKMEKMEKMDKPATTMKVLKGYVVDHMCASGMVKQSKEKAMARAKKHTTQCALEEDCAASGYGLVTDGKFVKFDKKGNEEAAKYLKSTKRKSDNYVEVTGIMDGEMFAVSSLKPIEDKMEMKGDMKEEMPMEHDMPMKKDMSKKKKDM